MFLSEVNAVQFEFNHNHRNLPVYFGDAMSLLSLAATLLVFSCSNGDGGEFCDEIGTACEFEGELPSHVVMARLVGMIGDDVCWVGDTDGARLFNELVWNSNPAALLLLLISSVSVPFTLPFDGDAVTR